MELHWGTVLRPSRQCCRKTGHLCHQSTHLLRYRALGPTVSAGSDPGCGLAECSVQHPWPEALSIGNPTPPSDPEPAPVRPGSVFPPNPSPLHPIPAPASCELSHRVVITCPESWFPRLGPALDPWGLLPFLHQSLAHPRYQLLVPRGPWAVKI